MPESVRGITRRQFAAGATIFAFTPSILRAQVAESTPPSPGVRIEVVATGLEGPRFIAIDGETVYVTQAGIGGDTPVHAPPSDGSTIGFRGESGTLSRLHPDGWLTVIAGGFQSYAIGETGEVAGPAGLALDGAGMAYVAVSAPGSLLADTDLTGEENVLIQVDLATGESRIVADLGRYELEHDPDPVAIGSRPCGVAVSEGVAYVADGGGNSLLAVDLASGEITTFAVPGGFDASFPSDEGNPRRAGEATVDSAPSGVRFGPDGRLFLTYLTGSPYPAGLAGVDAFTPDGEREPFASGLTMISDVAFASDGTAYAVMVSSEPANDGPGGIIRLSADGNHALVVDGLEAPHGLAFDANDVLYVTSKTTLAAPGGEILKITGVTTATGVPLQVAAEALPATVHIVMSDMYFEPSAITIPADTDVLFTFRNHGFIQHDILVAGTEVRSGVLAGGQSGEMIVNLPAGHYEFLCTQIGHRQAGMVGTLTVE
jgi:uncharacterized cupredoxin-like copper-binding protein/DNA-binding beta-propeller fold protein YncE